MKNYRIVLIILLLSIVIVSYVIIDRKKETNITLITYDKFLTLQDDGGTHFDTRYEIDFSKNLVIKLEDYYKGFEGLKYQNKKLYQKKLTQKESKTLKELLKEISNNRKYYEQDLEHTYLYYELKEKNLKIYDKKMIQKLEKILEEN